MGTRYTFKECTFLHVSMWYRLDVAGGTLRQNSLPLNSIGTCNVGILKYNLGIVVVLFLANEQKHFSSLQGNMVSISYPIHSPFFLPLSFVLCLLFCCPAPFLAPTFGCSVTLEAFSSLIIYTATFADQSLWQTLCPQPARDGVRQKPLSTVLLR